MPAVNRGANAGAGVGTAQAVIALMSGAGLGWFRLRHHFVKSYGAAREIPDGFHVPERNAVGLPLRNSSGRYAEVRSKSATAALLCFKPIG